MIRDRTSFIHFEFRGGFCKEGDVTIDMRIISAWLSGGWMH